MNDLNNLIQQYCNGSVEYKRISEIADTNIGLATSVTAHKTKAGVRLLHNSDIQENKIVIKKDEFITEAFANKNSGKRFKYHDVITVHTGDVGTSAVIEREYVDCIGFTTITTRIRDLNYVDPYYLAHYLNSEICKADIAKITISDRSNLNQKEYETLEIPIPPIQIQKEIVRVLDKLTELENELETELMTELTLRQKQYVHYLDKIMSFEDYEGEVDWKPLKDIATNWFRGNGIKREEITETGMPCIRYGEIYTTYGIHFATCVSHTPVGVMNNPKIAKKGTILFAITGESVEDIATSTAYLGEEDILVGGDILAMEHEQDAKYLAYALSTTSARLQKAKGRIKSKVVHSNKNDISEIIIPIPADINEQKSIAERLDRLNTLINNIPVVLRTEINMRHQEYNYFRQKLLTFK